MSLFDRIKEALQHTPEDSEMVRSAWQAITKPDGAERFSRGIKLIEHGYTGRTRKAVEAVLDRVGATVTKDHAATLKAEATAGDGPTITLYAASLAAEAAKYSLPSTIDWKAIITMLLSLLPACGL